MPNRTMSPLRSNTSMLEASAMVSWDGTELDAVIPGRGTGEDQGVPCPADNRLQTLVALVGQIQIKYLSK